MQRSEILINALQIAEIGPGTQYFHLPLDTPRQTNALVCLTNSGDVYNAAALSA